MNIYETALKKYGKEAQLRQAQEELAELIVAISHYLRNRAGAESELHEEIADCMIMMAQLETMFSGDKLSREINKKVTALKRKLEE